MTKEQKERAIRTIEGATLGYGVFKFRGEPCCTLGWLAWEANGRKFEPEQGVWDIFGYQVLKDAFGLSPKQQDDLINLNDRSYLNPDDRKKRILTYLEQVETDD